MNCKICGKDFSFSWTDTHGIGQCFYCGAPYRIFHYDENNKRIEKEPECYVADEWVPLLIEYHNTTKRIFPSGFSFHGGQERATQSDCEAFADWCKQNESRLPKQASA